MSSCLSHERNSTRNPHRRFSCQGFHAGRQSASTLRRLDIVCNPSRREKRERDDITTLDLRKMVASRRRVVQPALAEDATNGLPGVLRQLLMDMLEHVREIDRKIDVMEAQIRQWHRHNEASQRLAEMPGIGLLTATALAGHVGPQAQGFISGRHLAAYLGLVPRQHSSGSKQHLAHISKRGDPYLRTMLIHGARAVVRMCQGVQRRGQTPNDPWLEHLLTRKHPNQTAVAQANRNARIVWALLAGNRAYRSPVAAT